MKNFSKLLLLLIIPIFSFATTSYSDPNAYKTDFPIFVNGDVQSIENSFKFIKILLSDSDFINNIVSLMAFVLTGVAGWRTFKTQALTGAVVNLMYLSVGVLSLTGSLPVSVHIEDQRTQIDYAKYGGINYAKVDGIPFPIASLLSVSSTITLAIVEKVEQATVDVDSDQVSGQAIGFATAFSDVTKIINYAKYSSNSTSSIFEQNLVEYVSTCILDKAYYSGTAQKDIIRKVRNPQADIFKELNASTLGISSEPITFTDSLGNSYGTCGDLYNYLSTNYSTVADDTLALLDKSLTGSGVYIDMSKVTNAKITDSLISGEMGQFKAYIMNVAAVRPISRAIRNSSGTTISGQDLANSITLEATNAKLQSEGAGQFRWMAEVLPMGYHFMLGIVYSCSVFVMIVSIAMGYEKGFALISNYAQGLLSFDFIKVGLEMANNSVNQYSKFHASDVLSSLGSNPATIENLPYHLEYIASMTGLAGILGVGAIFIIPTIVFTGKVAVAAGSLSSLGGLYRGNAIDTATKTTAEQKAKEDAYNDSLKMASLEKAGYTLPSNMGAGDYYGQLQKDVSDASKALGLASMGSDAIRDSGKSDAMSEMSNISSKQTIGNNTTASQHIASGSATGSMQVGSISGTAEFVDNNGINGLMQGAKVQSLKEKYGVDASGKTMTEEQAQRVGTSQASFQNAQDIATVDSRKKAGLLNDDYMASDLSKRSMTNRFNKESFEFAGVGNAIIDDNDLKNYETQGRGKFEETAISAKAYSDKATNNGVLTNEYKDAVYGSEGAKIGAMVATTEAMGGSGKQIAFAESSAAVKATEDTSALKSKLIEAGLSKEDAENFGKNAGESFKNTLNTLGSIADAKSGAQTRSDIDTIKAAGGNEGYKSTVARMSAGQMGANVATIEAADDKENGGIGYENFLKKSARDKVTTGMSSLKGKEDAGMIDSTGALTKLGQSTVEGSSYLDAQKQIGNVKGMKSVMDEHPEYIESYVNQSVKAAEKFGRKDAVISDFEKAGLISKEEDGSISVHAENFAQAKAYLNANNMNSHNALVAGGMVLSGALGEKSTVQATALNSSAGGEKTDIYNDQKNLNNTDPLTTLALKRFDGDLQKAADWARSADGAKWAMDPRNELSLVAAETTNQVLPKNMQGEHGETAAIVAGSLGAGGAGLYALNKFTQKPIKVDTDKFKQITDDNGNIQGYEDEKGNKVADKNGYKLDKHGEKVKSGVVGRTGRAFANKMGGYKDNLLSSKNSNETSPASSTAENKTTDTVTNHNDNEPKNSTSNHNNSLNKDNNGSITQNEKTLNSKNRKALDDALSNQSKINEQAVESGNMTVDKFVEDEQKFDKIRKDIDNGKLHSKALSDVGIKASSLGLEVGDKGFIDFVATNEKAADFEKRKAAKIASMELKGEDTTLLKEENGLIRDNESIQNDLNENQKRVENNSKLKNSIEQAESFKNKFENGGTFNKNDLIGVNGFKENTVLGEMNQNINNLKDKLSQTPDGPEHSRLQSDLEQLESVRDKFNSGSSITKQELMDSTGMRSENIIGRVDEHIASAKGQFANTMTPDRVEGLQNQIKANNLIEKGSINPEITHGNIANTSEAHSVNTSEIHAPKAPGIIGGMLSLAGMTILADSAVGSVIGNQDTIANNVKSGNYGVAADKTAEGMDPFMVGYKTIKEQMGKAKSNINNGEYLSAMSDVASTPVAFTKNLFNDGFDAGKGAHQLYDGWSNNRSVMDGVNTETLGNELRNEMNTMSFGNNNILQNNNSNAMHLQSIGGPVDIGQNNERKMRINGMQTQIPYEDFQQQMQQNPQLRNDFATLVSSSDMYSGGKIESSTNSTEALIEQINKGFNTQETFSMLQMKNINTMTSYSSELMERTEEMHERMEKFGKFLDEQSKK